MAKLLDDVTDLLKIVVIGESGVGKTSLVARYTQGVFSSDMAHTIGVAFSSKNVVVHGHSVRLQIWDTGAMPAPSRTARGSGQKRFRQAVTTYYKGQTHGVVLCYDITSPESFERLGGWLADMREHATPKAVAIVGTKSDLGEARRVSAESGRAFAASNKALFFESSALSCSNVDEVFHAIASEILGATTPGATEASPLLNPLVQGSPPRKTDDPNACCCSLM
eukprot:m51a1_g8251 hypothetical protein (223) ;mRNA; r:141023-142061